MLLNGRYLSSILPPFFSLLLAAYTNGEAKNKPNKENESNNAGDDDNHEEVALRRDFFDAVGWWGEGLDGDIGVIKEGIKERRSGEDELAGSLVEGGRRNVGQNAVDGGESGDLDGSGT